MRSNLYEVVEGRDCGHSRDGIVQMMADGTEAVLKEVGEPCVLGLEMSDDVIVHPHFYHTPPRQE
jgi:hypothetical protein